MQANCRTALPPDVRKAYGLPLTVKMNLGLRPVQGRSPNLLKAEGLPTAVLVHRHLHFE